jgi:hypothetical protein
VGVEPTGDTARCRPPVLKTVKLTGTHALPLHPVYDISRKRQNAIAAQGGTGYDCAFFSGKRLARQERNYGTKEDVMKTAIGSGLLWFLGMFALLVTTPPASASCGFLVLKPTSMNFGSIPVGESSDPRTTILKNADICKEPFQIAISITGPDKGDFSQKNNCPGELGYPNSCKIKVIFTPKDTGLRTAPFRSIIEQEQDQGI